MKKRYLSILLALAFGAGSLLAGCATSESGTLIDAYTGTETDVNGDMRINEELFFRNGLKGVSADPFVFDNTARDGYYYIVSTDGAAYMYRSKNMMDLEPVGPAVMATNEAEKAVVNVTPFWAPEIVYDADANGGEGLYYLFFSTYGVADDYGGEAGLVSKNSTTKVQVLFVATSETARGPYTLVNMDNSGKIPAFVSGRIEAMAAESPFTDEVRTELGAENVVTLVSSFDFLPEKVFPQSWVATTAFVEKNPDIVLRFMRAYLKGIDDRYSHIEETTQKVADYIHTDYETAYQVVGRTNFIDTAEMKELAEDGTTYQYYDGLTDLFIEAGLLDPKFDIPAQEYVDLSFLIQALEDIGR